MEKQKFTIFRLLNVEKIEQLMCNNKILKNIVLCLAFLQDNDQM